MMFINDFEPLFSFFFNILIIVNAFANVIYILYL